MSDTYSYEVLEPGGHARLVGNVLDRISEASANPASAVGSSSAMLGDPETASWMERTTAADGAALIESVQGNTLRWNQICTGQNTDQVVDGITRTVTASGGITLVGTVTTAPEYNQLFLSDIINFKRDGRKYLIKASKDVGTPLRLTGYTNSDSNRAFIWSATGSSNWGARVAAYVPVGTELNVTDLHISVFDLTAMFGAGNEPATVAEFEALFPNTYYPYDAGSLLPVRMEGVETVAADESWSSELAIPAATYFPQGMRSAGSVYDELRADSAITRVGERAYQSGDESDASVITDGTVTHYALATPTTTPIDPPLTLSYRTGAGGTERVMLASGTTSAPPVFVTRYPLDPADLAASIAPRESATAEANHAVGDLIMLGFTLCKVTTAIARGEAITIGTNVTQTSVAAEIAALS